MGRHSKPPRIRIPRAMPTTVAAAAAAPTLAGVVAALVLTQQAPSAIAEATPGTPGSAPHQAAAGSGREPVISAARLLNAARQVVARRSSAPAAPVSYTVRPGDTLSSIAASVYHNADAWPVLYWANHGTGQNQIQWADNVTAGQVLSIPAEPATVPAPPAQLAPAQTAPAYVPQHASTAPVVAQSSGSGWQNGSSDASYTGGVPGGAFGQCVVSQESGGQAQIMNSTGHYGLYQFSASTWAEYGGNPADFGNASVAEQNQVFANALAAGGQSNWAPYDGC